MKWTYWALLPAFLSISTWAAADNPPAQKKNLDEVSMGSVAMDSPIEMIKRMTALTEYLLDTTKIKVTFRSSANLDSAVEDIGAGRTQIAYLTPVAYIEARKKYGVIPLVAPTINGRPYFALAIGVKAGSGIEFPEELKGKRFAFGDQKAFLQRAAIRSMGLNTNDFSSLVYLNHYDTIAKSILAGDVDGGILKDSVAESFRGKGVKVIASTAPLPSYVFAVNHTMPEAVRNELRDALLALNRSTPKKAKVLARFDNSYDGFVVIDDDDYNPVRKLIEPFKTKP